MQNTFVNTVVGYFGERSQAEKAIDDLLGLDESRLALPLSHDMALMNLELSR